MLNSSGTCEGDKIKVVRATKQGAPDGSEDCLFYKSMDGSELSVTRNQTKADGASRYPCAPAGSKRSCVTSASATAATQGELESTLHMPPGSINNKGQTVEKASKKARGGKS